MQGCLLDPSLWVNPGVTRRHVMHLIAAVRMAWLGHDACIVPARCQHEGGVGVGLQDPLVDRAPRRDMITHRPHHQQWRLDVHQRDPFAFKSEMALGQCVMEKQ